MSTSLVAAGFNSDETVIEYVDPRKIVNSWYSRPILPRDEAIVREGFVLHGYIDTYLISCRLATAPEIETFFQKKPHCYSPEKACEVTRSIMQGDSTGNAGGYRFCYDGHIRKYVASRLIEQGILTQGFKLKSELRQSMSVQDEIAFALSRNSLHSYCVPLSFIVTLLRCHDYDSEINAALKGTKTKNLSATDVGRRLVLSTAKNLADEKTIAKQAETKRQILGVSRKLPNETLEYLREFLCQDEGGLQVAFTLANLRAIPRSITEKECTCLVKRCIRYYEVCLPAPKPLLAKDVANQLVHVRRAEQELSKFKSLCDYEEIPVQLNTIAERMLCTQHLDIELSENVLKQALFIPLETACRNLVPNGTNHLDIARKRLEDKSKQNDNLDNKVPPLNSDSDRTNPDADNSNRGSSTSEEGPEQGGNDTDSSAENMGGIPDGEEQPEPGRSGDKDKVTPSNVHPSDELENEVAYRGTANVSGSGDVLPVGWKLIQTSPEDFVRQLDEWKLVQGKSDLVVTRLTNDDNNEGCLKQIVRHCGMAMNLSGVCHMFCNFIQFAKLYSIVCDEGMQMMKHPMIYVQDPSTVKKKTLSQHPQESGFIAAVFWRSPDRKQKHHYSYKKGYFRSTLPPWLNCVTNCLPAQKPLASRNGTMLKVLDLGKDLSTFVLEQWCKPGGLCYNPLSGPMSVGLACIDLGIQYIAVEEDQELFYAAKRRLVESVSTQTRKRRKMEHESPSDEKTVSDGGESSFCGIGKDLCLFSGQRATFACKGCGVAMHDLCDWAKVVKNMDIALREMISVCSESCFYKSPAA